MLRGCVGTSWLATTAVGLVMSVAVMGGAQAVPPPSLIVSAPPPGETLTIASDQTYGTTIIGELGGESGTLIVGAGAQLETGMVGEPGAIIAVEAGSVGSVTISGAGTVWSDVGNRVVVGQGGVGAVTVKDGAAMAVTGLNTATLDGSSATLTFSGPGTSFVSQQHVSLGSEHGDGTTTLIVENGASFETVGGFGDDPGGGLYINNATVIVTGAGTSMRIGTRNPGTADTWSTADGWFAFNSGTVLVADGAELEVDGAYVSGDADGGFADMTVTGAGTVLDAHLLIYVGGNGNGTAGDGMLTIADGAVATASVVSAGVDAGSTGTILLTGAGSSLATVPHGTFLGNVYASTYGDGTIIVQEGASLAAANKLFITFADGAVGRLIIGAAEGEAPVAPGTVTAAAGIHFGDGDGALVFNHTGTDLVFASTLESMSAGNGEIRHLAGTTNLTGASPNFTGVVNLLGGTLLVNGDIGGSEVTIGDGGTLGGSGTVGGLLAQAGAIVSPGNSIGTMTVMGDVTLDAGATYVAELGAAGISDRISATGTAFIDGAALSLVAVDRTASYKGPQTYTIIEADAGVTGGFGPITTNSLFFDVAVDEQGQLVTVSLSVADDAFATVAETRNQRATALALGALAQSGPALDLYNAILLSPSASDARRAFDRLSGEVHASVQSLLVEDAALVRDTMIGRLRATAGPGVWAAGFGSWTERDDAGSAAALSADTQGFLIGADTQLDGGWRLGIAGGYGRTSFDIEGRAAAGDADTWHLGLYGGNRWGGLGLRGGLAYAWHDVSASRSIVFPGFSDGADSSYGAGLFQAFGELGYRIGGDLGSDIGGIGAVEPFAGLAYVTLDPGRYEERGGAAALDGRGAGMDTAISTLGVRLEAGFDLGGVAATLTGAAGWQHAFGDVTPAATHAFAGSGAFTVEGLPLAEDAAVVEAGLGLALSEAATLGIAYSGRFGDGVTRNGVAATLKLGF